MNEFKRWLMLVDVITLNDNVRSIKMMGNDGGWQRKTVREDNDGRYSYKKGNISE